jgi:carbamoyltransferase
MPGADLGRGWSDDEIEQYLKTAAIDYERPRDVADAVAEVLADNGIVAWFQGRSEYGPRALGHRSLLAHPGYEGNLERMNNVKGREQFRPVAPMVLAERASQIFSRGPIPSRYMLFVHDVAPEWRERIPTVTHVDGTARIQTVDRAENPLVARMLECFERRTGLLRWTCWPSDPSQSGERGRHWGPPATEPRTVVRHPIGRQPFS